MKFLLRGLFYCLCFGVILGSGLQKNENSPSKEGQNSRDGVLTSSSRVSSLPILCQFKLKIQEESLGIWLKKGVLSGRDLARKEELEKEISHLKNHCSNEDVLNDAQLNLSMLEDQRFAKNQQIVDAKLSKNFKVLQALDIEKTLLDEQILAAKMEILRMKDLLRSNEGHQNK